MSHIDEIVEKTRQHQLLHEFWPTKENLMRSMAIGNVCYNLKLGEAPWEQAFPLYFVIRPENWNAELGGRKGSRNSQCKKMKPGDETLNRNQYRRREGAELTLSEHTTTIASDVWHGIYSVNKQQKLGNRERNKHPSLARDAVTFRLSDTRKNWNLHRRCEQR